MAKRAGTIDIGINVPASEIRKAESQLNSLFNTTQSFNKNPIQSKQFTQPLGRITGAANEFNKSLEASNARVIAFGASAGAIFAVQSALQQLVRTTITVEQQLTNISVLLNETDKNFQRFSDGLYKTAKATGQSFADVASSAEELARQGLNVNDTLKRNQSAMILSKLGAMDVKNATDSLTAAMYTFGKAAGDSTQIVNKLAQVDAAFAVSSGDLAEAIKRTGAAAVSANVSFEELISVVTVAQEKTARGGSVIGNSFKTIFTRIQRPETLRQLKDLGVVVEDSNRQMLPAIQILKNYAKVYDTLAPTLKATSAEQLAGVFQVNVLKAVLPDLASAYGRYDKALGIANNTTNEASERMKVLVSTSEGALNATTVNLTKFASEVGNLTVKPALDRILKMINSFADLISPKNFFGLGEKVGEAVYQGMGKIIEGPGLALLGVVLTKIGAKLAVFVKDASAGFMGMETASQKLAATQNIIQNVLAERPKLIQQATASEEGMVAVARILAEKIKASRVEMERLKTAANAAAPAVLAMSGGGGTGKGRKAGGKGAGGFVPGFAAGFVPNFNMAAQERRLAEAGGYQAGKIRQATIPGVGKVTYNGNEDIKKMPGLEQPAIMPPALSNAGRNYREAFRGAHGYDPYNMGHGFVPNFAPMVKLSTAGQERFGKKEIAQSSVTKYYKAGDFEDKWLAQDSNYSFSAQKAKKDHRDKMTGTRDSAFTHIFDTQGKVGLLGFAGDYTSRSASARMKIKDISAMKELRERVPGLANDMMVFENVQVSNISQMHRMQKSKKKPFFDRISDFLAQPLANLADSFSQELLGNQGKLDTKAIASQLSGQNSLMPPGTEGDIFEAVLRIMTTQPAHLRKAFDSQRNFKAPFDFEEGANVGATPKFKESFGFDTRRYLKADAKRSATQDTINSLVKKGINQFILNPQGKFASMFQNVPGMSAKSGIAAGVSGGKQFISESEMKSARARVGQLKKGMALGFVPNFAAVGSRLGAEQNAREIRAVSSAVKRENEAGVPLNKIRVGTDKRLSGGVGVFNTSEGSLAHAIDMHMSRGANMRDIQTMGKAMGFVPNFAGASMSTRVIPPSSAPAGAAANAQVNAQLESAANKVNETSMMMSMGLMMAGGQLAAYSERLRTANEGVANFGSTVTNIAAQTAMYAPVIQMATSSMGGIAGAFNKLNSSVLAGQVAMGGWITSLRAGSAANAVSGGTGLGARIMGTKASGAFMKGKATRGFGDIFGSIRQGYGTSRAAGATRLAALTAGGKSAAAGGGLMGGAAGALLSPVGIAAGVGALAYGGAKLHGSIKNRDINKSGVDLAESTKRTADQYSKLNTVMDSASAAAQKYAEALQKGDKAAADSAKRELLGTVAGGGRAMDALIGKQGIKAGGKTFKSSSEVMNRLRDADISPEEIQELLGGIKSASAKTASMSKAAGDVSSLFDTFVKNQGPIYSTDMGAGQLEAAAIGLGVTMEGINKDALAKVKEEAGLLGSTIENVKDGLGGIITSNEGQQLATRMKALVEATGNLTPQQKALAVRLGQLGNVAHMNENELHRLAKEVLKEFNGQIEDAGARLEELDKPLQQSKKQIFDLYKSSRKLSKVMDDQAKDFAFASKLEKLMTDRAMKMFDVGTKTLSSALSQTASELSNIEFKNMAELRRLELRTQQQVQEEYRATQQKLSSAVTSVIGSQLNQVKQGGQQVFGLQGNEFKTVVENGFIPSIQKAIANADFDGADDAITAAINAIKVKDGTAKKLFDDIQKSVDSARRSSVEAIQLDREQLKTQKELINAQREAAIQQLKLANEINFAGGIAGGGGAPQKAIERVLSNNLNMRRGFAMGDNDLQTGALLDQIKVLNTLKVGAGPNPANAATQVLTDQIETNLKQFLAGTGLAGQFSPTDIREMAKKQADNAIKPDVTLDDIKTTLEKNHYEGESLKVFVTNIDGPATNTNNGQAAPGGGFNLRGINEVIRAHNEAMDRSPGPDPFRLKPIPMNPDGTFKGPRGASGAAGASGPAGVPPLPVPPLPGTAPTSSKNPLQRYRELIAQGGDFRKRIGVGMVSDKFFNSFLAAENLVGDANRKLSLPTMNPKVNKTKQQQQRDRIQFLQKKLRGGLSTTVGVPDRSGIGLGSASFTEMDPLRGIGTQENLFSRSQHATYKMFQASSPERQKDFLTPGKPNSYRTVESEKNRIAGLKETLRIGEMIDRLAKMGLVNLDKKGVYTGFNYGGVKVPGMDFVDGKTSGTQGMKFLTERQAALQKVVSGETTGRNIISKEQAKKELDLTNKVIIELKKQNDATRDLINNAKKELKLLQEQALDRGVLSKAKEAAERSLQAFQKMGLDRASAGANQIGDLLQSFSEAKQRGQANKIDIDMAGSEAKLNAMISKALGDDKLTKSELKDITTAFKTETAKIAARTAQFAQADKTGRTLLKQNQVNISPIEAALRQFEITFANKNIIQSFTGIQDATANLLNTNKNWTSGLNMAKEGLNSLNDDLAVLTFNSDAEKLKFVNVQLSKLQSNISFEKYKAGIATIAEARQQIVNTIDVLRATGGSNADIEKQIQLYQKLSDAQIKQTKTLQSGLSRQQFIDSVQESIIALNKEIITLGENGEKTKHVEQELISIRNQVLKGKLSEEEAEKKINLTLKETNMSFDKLRETLGLIDGAELRKRFAEGFAGLYGETRVLGKKTIENALIGMTLAGQEVSDKQKKEMLEGLGLSIFDEVSRMSSESLSAQTTALRDYALSAGSYQEAVGKLKDLEDARRGIFEDLINKEITASEAMIRLQNSLSGLTRLNLKADFVAGRISADEYRQTIQQLNEGMRQGTAGVKGDFGTIKEEIGNLFLLDKDYRFNQTKEGLKDVFSTLRDGTKGALKEVIMGTSSMKEAFQKVFASIGEKMLDRTIGMFVDSLFYLGTGFLRRNQGGVVGYNGGGVVQGGSGVRDDVPALLTKGEYVVRKSAVNKYGSGFLEKVNSGKIRKYQDGGSASFNLANQFDYNDPKRPTAGTMNVDSRMSAFAQTDQNNPMNQLKFDKEQTLDSYLKEKAQYEEQKRQAMAQYKKQRKGIIKQAVIQIAMTYATQKLGEAIDKKMMTPSTGSLGTQKPHSDPKMSGYDIDGNPLGGDTTGHFGSGDPSLNNWLKSQGINPYSDQTSKVLRATGSFSPRRSPRNRTGLYFGNRRSQGGIMHTGGGGSDNIPALLTGGEYVVNKRSVDHYGLKFMEDLNKGRLPGFNRGGLVGEGGNGTPTATGTGGAPSNVNNNITINVTVEKDGNVSTDTTNEQAGGNQNTQGALQEEERNKQFSGAIKDAVVREIVEQKRPGGLLYNEKRTNS